MIKNKFETKIFLTILVLLSMLSNAFGQEFVQVPMKEYEGYYEPLFLDDFENPQNAHVIHYINIDGERYEIKSKDLINAEPGSKVLVRGAIVGNNFMLENYLASRKEELDDLYSYDIELPSEEGGNYLWLYILSGIGLVILGMISLLKVQRSNKLQTKKYVIDNLKKGFTKQQIANMLLKNGYTKKEIIEALKSIE